jgi:hypothetical protein
MKTIEPDGAAAILVKDGAGRCWSFSSLAEFEKQRGECVAAEIAQLPAPVRAELNAITAAKVAAAAEKA